MLELLKLHSWGRSFKYRFKCSTRMADGFKFEKDWMDYLATQFLSRHIDMRS